MKQYPFQVKARELRNKFQKTLFSIVKILGVVVSENLSVCIFVGARRRWCSFFKAGAIGIKNGFLWEIT